MGTISAGTLLLAGFIVLLYGVLVGGTWVRRTPGKTWDTVSTLIFIVVAAAATLNLVYLGARQSDAFDKAKRSLDCVAVQLEAIRAQAPPDRCSVRWDN